MRAPGPADLERRAGHLQHLLRLAGVEVPQHHGLAELLHRLGVLRHLAERPHVVLEPGEGRGQHDVLARQDAGVVAVAVGDLLDLGALRVLVGRQPVRRDVVAVVGVLDERRLPGLALVRQARDQHAAGQRIGAVRADGAAALLDEVVDGLDELRRGGVARDVEDEDLASPTGRRPRTGAGRR